MIEVFAVYSECKYLAHTVLNLNVYFLFLGVMYNDDGDIIISEEEFLEINRLKDLQSSYKTDYEELKNLKKEAQYCQQLVDQCRQKLVQGENY